MPKLNLKDIDNLMDDTYSRKQKIKRDQEQQKQMIAARHKTKN